MICLLTIVMEFFFFFKHCFMLEYKKLLQVIRVILIQISAWA